MKKDEIYKILVSLSKKKMSPDEAYTHLKDLPFKDMGFVKVDYHREMRMGLPETIFCKGKTVNQVLKIFQEMKKRTNIMATKADDEMIKVIKKKYPEAEVFPDAGIIFLGKYPKAVKAKVVVLTAGTSDIPVAMESVIVCKAMGVNVEFFFDVGVAGIHRLLKYKDKIQTADVIIVAAGMEGALPGVVAGLFGLPVVAVPTSVGYGASFSGIAPLLTMLNTCAPGVVVVNIDNGYGAGYFAGLTAKRGLK
ncbi:MAG: nickel pincer cofactor biosynthesis protein LarB [Spirochaetes bacterium]|nr:nickel pincer cofactor biosynthesis protein LarB [Spirochaetota bacterium]